VAADYDKQSGNWQILSEEAKSLIQQLLCVDPNQRLTAQEALVHGWFN
jgi:serine/threonine protein kinase